MKLKVIVYILAFILFNCKDKTKNLFLQQDQISIVQPRLLATNQLIDSVEYLTANLKLEGVKIYYTTNGETPTEQSIEYTKPIKITKPGNYKFRAYHPDWKESDISEKIFYKKGLDIDSIIWHTNANNHYKGVGPLTLNNNKKGALDFKDKQWLGFDTIAKASLKLKGLAQVKSFTIGYLSDPASWIFPPKNITVETSRDGIHFNSKTIEIQQLDSISKTEVKSITIPVNENVEYVRIEVRNIDSIPQWHEGKGSKAWLFMDEWVFNH